MKKLLVTVLLVLAVRLPAIAGEIDIGGFTRPTAPDGFLYVLINGLWSLISI